MEFGSKVIKIKVFKEFFQPQFLSTMKLNELNRKLGKKTFIFKFFFETNSSPFISGYGHMEMMSETREKERAHRFFGEKNQLFCKVITRQVAHKVTYRGAFWRGNLSLFGPQ